MSAVVVLVPEGLDDPARPSGGNTYDRRVCQGLRSLGWEVDERAAPGEWPDPHPAALRGLADLLAGLAPGTVVLADGLIASAAPEVLVPEASRLPLVVLVHQPLGAQALVRRSGGGATRHTGPDVVARERSVLEAAAAVVATSSWTRDWLEEHYELASAGLQVAEPGVDAAPHAPGSSSGGDLLCVAAVVPGKGHDLLVAALAQLVDLPWTCVCAGSLTRDREFVERLDRQARQAGVAGRLRFTGPLAGEDLDLAYAGADLLVLPTRGETYGMVVSEALARGLPVVATAVGGVPQTLGVARDGQLPGALVPPEDPRALAAALRGWLTDPALRQRTRTAALERRAGLHRWTVTADAVARVLVEVANASADATANATAGTTGSTAGSTA